MKGLENRGQIEIEVRNLQKNFGDLKVLAGIDFDVFQHEVVALIGPSGSGKSTFLRCLNLLELPDQGEIYWRKDLVDYRHMTPRQLSGHRARMGMVFQHFHLFPHRDVLTNVTEGPIQVKKEDPRTARRRAKELLEVVGLGDKIDAWPEQLSGGQKQRVAIARALAMDPEVLLLDEVTSALDVEMIAGINELLAGLAGQGMTMVVVTHDLAFARQVAQRIAFFDQGRILESGTVEDVLDHPRASRLREFLSTVGGV